MEFEKTKGPERTLAEVDSGHQDVGVGYVTDSRDIESAPSKWAGLNRLTEKMGVETVGCDRLPEEARDPTQKPWSTSNFYYISLSSITQNWT